MTSVLLVRLGALGDVVHAMPVVAALRKAFPEARIDWLVDPRYVEVVRLVDGVNRAVGFDPRGLIDAHQRAATMAVIGELRQERYDVVFDLQGLVKSAAAARLAGGTQTIGFTREHLREPAARFFYTRVVDVPAGLHVVRKNLSLLSAVGVAQAEPRFALNVPVSTSTRELQDRFGESGYIAVNPGAAWPNKRWPADRFGLVSAAVRDAHGVRSLVVWGPGEESLAANVVASSNGAAELAPPTTVTELFGVFSHARLAMAGDTGPLHIAGAMGTPLVALFGPTDPLRNGPWHGDDITLSRAARCECQYERQCRKAVPCIDDIRVEEVVDAVGARLAAAVRRAGA